MKIIAVIPARLSSKRLPKKQLLKIGKKNLIEIIHNKLSKIFEKKNIFVATSNHKSDDKLYFFCRKKKINVFRGPLNNVIKRLYLLANHENAYGLVRINGDSPLFNLVDLKKILRIFKNKRFDLVTNIFPRSYPVGLSIEVLKTQLLRRVLKEIKKKSHKEHITSYVYENFKKFKIYNMKNKIDYSKIHLAVDTKQDFIKIKKILINPKYRKFSLKKLIKVYEKN